MTEQIGSWQDPAGEALDQEFPDGSDFMKHFFAVTWYEERFSGLRDKWEKRMNDPEAPEFRKMGKTAAWAVVRCQFPDINSEFQKIMTREREV